MALSVKLLDDGTLDTVVSVVCPRCEHDVEMRYCQEVGHCYRDAIGRLNEEDFFAMVEMDFQLNDCRHCHKYGEPGPVGKKEKCL